FDGAKLGYAGVEFKVPQRVTSIAYIGREGYSTNRLEGAYFQGSDDGVNYTTLFVVDQVRAYGYPYGMSFRTVADGLNADKAYRYFRIIGNAGMPDVFNIGELKLYIGSDSGTGNAGYRVAPPQGPSVAGKFNNLKNSAYDPYYSNVILLNEDRIYQVGAAWAYEKLDLTKPFSLESYVYMYHSSTNKAPTMADGITFTLQKDPRGLNAFSQPGGTMGEALGVYGRVWVKNALSIELDTKINTINPATNDECVTDTSGYGPHIAVVTPAAKILPANHGNLAKFTHSNKWYAFNISWTPSGAGGRLDYSFDGKSYSYTVASTVKQFGGTDVYWGFTGATGEETQINAVAFKALPDQKPQTAKVTYNPNGGVGTINTVTVPKGSIHVVTGQGYFRDGYTFNGWNTKPDGTGIAYQNGQTILVNDDITLYAQWKPNVALCTVSYLPGIGGTGGSTDTNLVVGSQYRILGPEAANVSRPWFNLSYWNTQSNGSGLIYLPGQTITLTGDLTLHAIWWSDGR
ncbi:MAG: InlB B-repeat-containing protein, partial [Clostridiales bacterium]|nr:InlB B-repeat-containing protein [Clostridiales bacterium]